MRGIAVGVDAGGSSTVSSYSCDGSFAGVRTSGGAALSHFGVQEASDRIVQAIHGLLHDMTPDAIHIGAAGAGRQAAARQLQAIVERAFPGARVTVADDAHIAFRARVPEGSGAVLVAGTGSIAYAENGTQAFRAGGYGPLLGDDGSGFAIGLAGVRTLARVYDQRASADTLARDIADRLGVQTQPELFERIYGAPNPVALLASLAPTVLAAAHRGERSANRIVQSAASELFDLVKSVAKKAGLLEERFPLVFSGGLLLENTLLSYLLELRLQNELPGATILKGANEPHRGALAAAERSLADA